MISCTEFIPAYSELFAYLEEKHGHGEVERFWSYLFQPDGHGIPLITFLEKEGIRGCFSYWTGTLREEAADFTLRLNEPAGWFLMEMHRCPSKGRLLALKEEIGLVPYPFYCYHCDYYRLAAEKAGLKYLFNFVGVDRAACSLLIYDPKVFDGRVIPDEHTETLDVRASQNEYFHRDFHSSLNMGLDYLGERFGREAVEEYLQRYTRAVYGSTFPALRAGGLGALQVHIRETYRKEKAPEVVRTQLEADCLQVRVSACPAVGHLRATGRRVSPWYAASTTVVLSTLAQAAGCRFTLESYQEETGAAQYRFDREAPAESGEAEHGAVSGR